MPLDAKSLVGSWSLESWIVHEHRAGSTTGADRPFGADATGLLIYAADGRMSATMSRSRRTLLSHPSPARASEASRAAAFSEYLAYCGRWWLEGDRLLHEVELSLNPVLIGTRQEREAVLAADGRTLDLVARERFTAAGLPMEREHLLRWRRAGDAAGGS